MFLLASGHKIILQKAVSMKAILQTLHTIVYFVISQLIITLSKCWADIMESTTLSLIWKVITARVESSLKPLQLWFIWLVVRGFATHLLLRMKLIIGQNSSEYDLWHTPKSDLFTMPYITLPQLWYTASSSFGKGEGLNHTAFLKCWYKKNHWHCAVLLEGCQKNWF